MQVSKLIHEEGGTLEQDLVRARELLRDAMAKIADFVTVLQESTAHARELSQLSKESEQAGRLTQVLDSIQSEATSAILGLQVEDVLGQLIEQTQRRIAALSRLSTTVAKVIDERPSLHPKDGKIHAHIAELEAERARVCVAQASLDSGDAELF
ncbi:MAG TPA: hypothetical protein VFQ35_03090 [Polyangiaceae bacterium]|nr:hypothetical protein [Polyangiaceae bacterium]